MREVEQFDKPLGRLWLLWLFVAGGGCSANFLLGACISAAFGTATVGLFECVIFLDWTRYMFLVGDVE
mgnify:CR=1 FL=1